jgi:hypothetical protein
MCKDLRCQSTTSRAFEDKSVFPEVSNSDCQRRGLLVSRMPLARGCVANTPAGPRPEASKKATRPSPQRARQGAPRRHRQWGVAVQHWLNAGSNHRKSKRKKGRKHTLRLRRPPEKRRSEQLLGLSPDALRQRKPPRPSPRQSKPSLLRWSRNPLRRNNRHRGRGYGGTSGELNRATGPLGSRRSLLPPIYAPEKPVT